MGLYYLLHFTLYTVKTYLFTADTTLYGLHTLKAIHRDAIFDAFVILTFFLMSKCQSTPGLW